MPRRSLHQLSLLIALLCAACQVGRNEPSKAELTKRAHEVSANLEAIHDQLPPTNPEPKDCPEGLKPLNIGYLGLSEAVERSTRTKVEQAHLFSMRSFFEQTTLRWFELARWRKGQEGPDVEIRALESAKHLRVGIVTSRTDAVVYDSEYTPGEVEAWLLTYELSTAKLVCAQKVTATSSESVAARRSDWGNQQSLKEDLDKNLDRAIELRLQSN